MPFQISRKAKVVGLNRLISVHCYLVVYYRCSGLQPVGVCTFGRSPWDIFLLNNLVLGIIDFYYGNTTLCT